MVASPRTTGPKSLKRKESYHEATKQIKLPTPKGNVNSSQQLVNAFIKTLSEALMLRGAGIQPGCGILDTCLRGLELMEKGLRPRSG
jgi:hypothetical protein